MSSESETKLAQAAELFAQGETQQRVDFPGLAKDSFQSCLTIRQEVLGGDHLDTAKAMHKLALVMAVHNDETEYRKNNYLRKVLGVYLSHLLYDSPEVIQVLFDLVAHCRSRRQRVTRDYRLAIEVEGELRDAELSYLISLCQIHDTAPPPPILVDLLWHRGRLLEEGGRCGEARTCYERRAAIYQESQPYSMWVHSALEDVLRFHPPGSEAYQAIQRERAQCSVFRETSSEIVAAARWWSNNLKERVLAIPPQAFKDNTWLMVQLLVKRHQSVESWVEKFEKALCLELPPWFITTALPPLVQIIIGNLCPATYPLRAALRAVGVESVETSSLFSHGNMYIKPGLVTVSLNNSEKPTVIYKASGT